MATRKKRKRRKGSLKKRLALSQVMKAFHAAQGHKKRKRRKK